MPADTNQILTTTAAKSMQDTAVDARTWLFWFVSDADPAHPGKITARAFTADHHGGAQPPDALVADTLDELHAMIPAGLTQRDRMPVDPPGIVETWD